MELEGERCGLRALNSEDIDPLLQLRLRNRAFFSAYEPRRPDPEDGYTRSSVAASIQRSAAERRSDRGYAFGIFDGGGTLVGRVSLSNVVRAAWQNCTLGYYVDQAHNNKGFGTEAVTLAVRFAFEHAYLHRVQAAVMPRNLASARVLLKAGFRHEGFAPRYLQIAGAWEDHDLYAVTVEESEARPQTSN